MHKIAIVDKMHNDGINLLKNNPKFECELIEDLSKKNLNSNGKILIFNLDTNNNEIPSFKLMKKKLSRSLKRDKKILKNIKNLYTYKKSKFIYKVNILREKYLVMIKKRYISILLPMTKSQIHKGVNEIEHKYKSNIKFRDKLICLIL